MPSRTKAILLVSCADRTGIVAEVAGFMHARECNIIRVDQSVDAEHGAFRMRMVIEPHQADLDRTTFEKELTALGDDKITWKIHWSDERMRMAILCTREPHCLHDLLQRHESGELDCDIPLVISNHETLRPTAEFFNIPFVHIPVEKGSKSESENRLREALAGHDIDVMVLARYMQILSDEFVSEWSNRIINIRRCRPLPTGTRPWSEAHRCHGPLRHRETRRGTDHRAGRDPVFPQGCSGRPRPQGT